MIKMLVRRSLKALLPQFHSHFSTAKDSSSLVPVEDGQKFYKNVYGVQLKKHILPKNTYNIPWRAQQMIEYRKKIPAYMVVLVNKVLQGAEELASREQGFKREPIEKFYQVATYCRINYMQKYAEIKGLYRVRINKCQSIVGQNEEGQEAKIIETDEEFDDMEDVQLDQGPVQVSSTEESPRMLTFNNPPRRIHLSLFNLQVDKIQEPIVRLDHLSEIKFKFLLQSYKLFFPSQSKIFLLFNPKQALKNVYLVGQQMSNQNMKVRQIQQILEQNQFQKKIEMIQEIMNKTLDWKNIYKNIQKTAESNLRNKKFYEYYSQILKIAKQSIQGKKGKQLFLQKVVKRFNEQEPPNHIKQIFNQEKEKYILMDETAVEAAVVKKYLEDLSQIPYTKKSDELYDLGYAEEALNQEHFGMKEVKDAILQIIAVGKLKGSLKGKIFCLVGGPGVGKTTIARSISKALARKFYSISLGGVTDSSVLKGHRRTYIGAYSGKIIEALKQCKTNNPVILLDQIDKMGSSYQGDPRSQLLQILDPNQNQSFVDNFIDVPIDLSNVLFICSANYEKNISKPLLDRMQKIKLHSYTDDEKKEIYKRHLLRRAIDKTGVKDEQFVLEEEILESLIYEYSEGEPGVRRLEKNIVQILQKIAFKIVEEVETLPITVTKSNLKEYLGNSYFKHKDHNSLHMGVAISLGGGDYGSRLTYIQSFKKSFAGKKGFQRGVMFTGSLGDIFKEAMNISYTFARNFLKNQLGNSFLFENEVHIHALDGAAKKDGSMDSLTICATLVSLALQKQVKTGFAMTGEITLHGRILRTHGIKQKILLAKRQKIMNVIVPFENQPDVEMLAQNVRQGLSIHYVSEFRDVFSLLFDIQFPSGLHEPLTQKHEESRFKQMSVQ